MGNKGLDGAHVGSEWDECPDSTHMGPIYTCLLGISGNTSTKEICGYYTLVLKIRRPYYVTESGSCASVFVFVSGRLPQFTPNQAETWRVVPP